MLKYAQFLQEQMVDTNIPLWKGKIKSEDEKTWRHDLSMKDEFVDMVTYNDFDDGQETEIDVSELKTYQSSLVKEKLEKFEEKYDSEGGVTKPPVVYELEDGTKLLHDGNHRVAAALNKGAKNIVVELRKCAK